MPGMRVDENSTVLVTGGAGFIGSHTVLELLELRAKVIVIDDLSNSPKESLSRVSDITGMSLTFYQLDLCDEHGLRKVFKNHPKIDAVIHFAGLKAVGESVIVPLNYYQKNLNSTTTLLKIMLEFDVNNIIFSSSATVYGVPETLPLKEDHPISGARITNPYGRTKYVNELIIHDTAKAYPKFHAVLLRYFNPVGAHPSGRIGEDPSGTPNNLMPYVAQVAIGKYPYVKIFGNDYPTKDGTGVRDYVHVTDLAKGHVKAISKFPSSTGSLKSAEQRVKTYNLGTGQGFSVIEMIEAMRKVSGHPIPAILHPRREGDVPEMVADPQKAIRELDGWEAKLDLETMCADLWRWQSNNPKGFLETPAPKSQIAHLAKL